MYKILSLMADSILGPINRRVLIVCLARLIGCWAMPSRLMFFLMLRFFSCLKGNLTTPLLLLNFFIVPSVKDPFDFAIVGLHRKGFLLMFKSVGTNRYLVTLIFRFPRSYTNSSSFSKLHSTRNLNLLVFKKFNLSIRLPRIIFICIRTILSMRLLNVVWL